jgi:hypothetical protein
MKILYHLIYSYEKDIIDDAVHPIMNSKHDVTLKLDLICSDIEHYEKCKALTDQYQHKSFFELRRENNQSARHNDALIYGYDTNNYDAVIFSEPGIHFKSTQDFDDFIDKAEPLLDKKFIIASRTCEGDGVFAAFQLVTRLGWEKIGCWDENFFFSTNENDWLMRAFKYCGNSLDWLEIVTSNNSYHIGKWFNPPEDTLTDWHLTKKATPHPISKVYENPGVQATIMQSQGLKNRYLMKKWNCVFSQPDAWYDPAIFSHPFNDPSLGFKIEVKDRMNPYGAYDRQDRSNSYFRFFDKPVGS